MRARRDIARTRAMDGRRLSYPHVTAALALFFSLSSGALAARHLLITSTKQIKPTVLSAIRGHAGWVGGPGAPGSQGAPGPNGPVGAAGTQGPPSGTPAVLAPEQ